MIRNVLWVAMVIAVSATLLTTSGCKSNPGSREFVPGKGWTPMK